MNTASHRTPDALDTALRGAVQGLVAGLRPEKIILFGSRARGTYSRRSDLDLFIVLETSDPALTRIGQGLNLSTCRPCPMTWTSSSTPTPNSSAAGTFPSSAAF